MRTKRAPVYSVSLCHRHQMTKTGTVAISPVNKRTLTLCLMNLLIMNPSQCHITVQNPEREYWIEENEEILPDLEDTVPPPFPPDDQLRQSDDEETQAVVWWVVLFLSVFQTLHSISDQAIRWLITFVYSL